VAALRRAILVLGPLPLLVLPVLLVVGRERWGWEPGRLSAGILAPGILASFAADAAGVHHQAVIFVASGVFWYVLGLCLLGSLIGRPGRFLRFILILLVAAAVVMVTIGLALLHWDPH
jgi:hypothetical protein